MSHDRSCTDGCEYYSYVNNPDCSNKDPLCTRQPKCKGRVLDCSFVDEDMSICFAVSNQRNYYIKEKKKYALFIIFNSLQVLKYADFLE